MLHHIKIASEEDVPALAQISRDTFCENFAHLYSPEDLGGYLGTAFSEEKLREEMAGDKTMFLIAYTPADEPAGYAKACPCRIPVDWLNESSGEVQRLYVDKAHQGSGLGRKLFEECLQYLKEEGFPEIYLGVWQKNLKAQQFYKSYGFEVTGEYKFKVGNHYDDEFVMKLTLP